MFLNERTGTFSVSSLEYSPHSKRANPDRLYDWLDSCRVSANLGGQGSGSQRPRTREEETWMTDPFYKWGHPRSEWPPPAGLAVE